MTLPLLARQRLIYLSGIDVQQELFKRFRWSLGQSYRGRGARSCWGHRRTRNPADLAPFDYLETFASETIHAGLGDK